MGLMIGAAVLIVIALVLLLVGLIFIIPHKRLSTYNGKTVGTITDMVRDAYSFNVLAAKKLESVYGIKRNKPIPKVGIKDRDTHTFYQVYEYTVNGVAYQHASGVGYNRSTISKRLGEKIDVFYDANDPFESSLSNGAVYKYLTIGLCSLGGVLLVVGIILLILSAGTF